MESMTAIATASAKRVSVSAISINKYIYIYYRKDDGVTKPIPNDTTQRTLASCVMVFT